MLIEQGEYEGVRLSACRRSGSIGASSPCLSSGTNCLRCCFGSNMWTDLIRINVKVPFYFACLVDVAKQFIARTMDAIAFSFQCTLRKNGSLYKPGSHEQIVHPFIMCLR